MAGIIFSTLAGFFWAIAIIIYKKSGDNFSPISLNLYKCILALICIIPIMIVMGVDFFPNKNFTDYLLIIISGVFGIAVADSLFFAALRRVGASYMAVIDCLYLPSVLLISFLYLDERIGVNGVFGGVLVFSGIFLGSCSKSNLAIKKNDLIYGTILGSLAIFLIAISIVMIKELLIDSNAVWVTFLRNGAGIVTLLILTLLSNQRKKILEDLIPSKDQKNIVIAGFCNFLALLFWIAGMKYAMVSIAAILNQLSIVFIYIFAVIFLNERATKLKTFSVTLAISGAVLAVFNDITISSYKTIILKAFDLILQVIQ
jgi:drug/metabolite transporter (DMT)-like permease